MKLIGFLALLPVFAQAAYPSQLQWAGCGNGLQCATLEFCQDGSSYGYRLEGDTSACGSKNGPLIRMTPGNKYKLTLRNTASDSALKTNLHTHGLHISGSGDADDVTRFVRGGECLDYTWDIPSDHPGGTNWYHPHYHTETNTQTSGGAFGMLIIEDTSTQLNSWADVSNDVVLQISNAGSLLGNGNSNEALFVEADKWYRLRVSVVTPGAKASNVGFDGGSCTVYKVASDGVWHSASFTSYSGTSFSLTGASRADFAIKCASGDTNIKWGQGVAATLSAGSFGLGTGQSSSGDDASDLGSAPARPNSLAFTQGPSNFYDVGLSGAQINGESWDEFNPLETIDYGTVNEWSISGSGAHPFHLHLYHMKIVSEGGCGAHEQGEFYDTLSASGSCNVQFYAIDIGQRLVMHCHVLSHEDNGAIHWFDVTGTPNPNNVDSPSYTCSAGGPTPTETPVPAPTETPAPAPTDAPGSCLVSGACSSSGDCCSERCKRGQCNVFETPAPTFPPTPPPTPPPTLAPTKAPTKAPTFPPTPPPTPPPTDACSTDVCSSNADCCSGNCNTGRGQCRRNRRLRASSPFMN